MKLVHSSVLALCFVQAVVCFFAVDQAKSLIDATTGVAQKLPDTLPSVDSIFSSSKNLVAGYPAEAVFTVINDFCKR